jgi:ComF family protein
MLRANLFIFEENNPNMWITDFINLFFPDTCYACGEVLVKGESIICTDCYYKLPRTNFHMEIDNPISKIFWCRADLYTATSFLFFNKGGKVQKLLHQLKYKNRPEVGFQLGKVFGAELRNSQFYQDIDFVIPVPLHPKKQKMRGYNQSDFIAKGIAESLGTSFSSEYLVRNTFTSTQTKKSRYSRWKNVDGKFSVVNIDKLAGKRVLLVDDVLTTGATLEACAQELLKVPKLTVSVATLAYALV